MTNMTQFVKERDEAFTDFVKTGNEDKLRKYCRKYGVSLPRNKKVLAGGVYKAVQGCTSIPEDVKALAAEKCIALGMNPFSTGMPWEVTQ